MDAATSAPPAEPQASGMSAFARVIGIFLSPVKTLRDIALRPTWLVPILLGTIGTLAVTAIVLPKMDWESILMKKMQGSDQKIPDAQLDSTIKIVKSVSMVTGGIWGAIGFAVICLVAALVYFAVIRMFGGETTYRKVFAIVSWSGLIYALKTALSIIPILGVETVNPESMNSLLPSNPAAFVTKEQVGPALYAALPFIDLFGIWGIVLTIIGLAAASNWSRGRCAATVLGLYGVIMLVVVLLGILNS